MSLLFLTNTIDAAKRPKGQTAVWRSFRIEEALRPRIMRKCITLGNV